MTQEQYETIIGRLERIEKKIGATATRTSGGETADDADLDGKYGNEEIRKMPSSKYWEAEDFTGVRMSDTTPEFLDAFAKYKDACAYMNEKSGDESKSKYIGYDRKSAARARGWAKRMRENHPSAKPPTVRGLLDDGDEPF